MLRVMPARPPAIVSLHIRYKEHAMDHFDGIHALADWQMEGLKPFKGLVKKVNNWVPQLKDSAPGAVEACRQSVDAGPDTPLVAFVGRLDPVKGVDTLIRAFRKIKRPDIRLAIVGDGSETAALKLWPKETAGSPLLDIPRHRLTGTARQTWSSCLRIMSLRAGRAGGDVLQYAAAGFRS